MDPANYGGKQPMAVDIDQMPETPQHRGSYHRRAHSDTAFRLDDLLLFDPSEFDISALDLPITPTPPPTSAAPGGSSAPMYVDSSDDSAASGSMGGPQNPSHHPKPFNHLRSLSMDSDFFDGLSLNATAPVDSGKGPSAAGERRAHHRHSNSMDGSSSSFELESGLVNGVKKAMAPDRLAELALMDPKRAKRILANRQSAARSKERKIRYTSELERKVQTLQTEATTLSAQVTMLQRDTTGLTAENKELKLRLQAMDQQAQLRDALNEKLREEVQRLKIATGQIPAVNGNPFNRGLPPQFSSHQSTMHHFGGQNQQQQQQQQLQMPPSSANQTLNGQTPPGFSNFSQSA